MLKRFQATGARIVNASRHNVLVKFAALVVLVALAVYLLTSAANGHDLGWGDIPTWVTGAGTVGALFVAFYQIGQERKRRIEQEAEDRQERRLAQARLIAAWEGISRASPVDGRERLGIQLVNGSAEPVYSLFACLVFIQGAAPHKIEDWLGHDRSQRPYPPFAVLPLLPPGRWSVTVRSVPDHPMQGRYGAEVAFTDRAGRHWIRRATGGLEELDASPIEFLNRGGLAGPYDWVAPTPET